MPKKTNSLSSFFWVFHFLLGCPKKKTHSLRVPPWKSTSGAIGGAFLSSKTEAQRPRSLWSERLVSLQPLGRRFLGNMEIETATMGIFWYIIPTEIWKIGLWCPNTREDWFPLPPVGNVVHFLDLQLDIWHLHWVPLYTIEAVRLDRRILTWTCW
jgi:hypothetical protein